MNKCIDDQEHKFVTILRREHSWDETSQVVRWCRVCGAIRTDLDYDGRTKEGGISYPSCKKME